MAGRPAQTDQIAELRRRLEATRFDVERAAFDVRHRYDIPARLRGSMRQHPRGWFFGAMGTGLLAALSFGRRRKRHRAAEVPARSRGSAMLMGTAGFLFTVMKPVARQWLTRRFIDRP
jgi:hypothetical protein